MNLKKHFAISLSALFAVTSFAQEESAQDEPSWDVNDDQFHTQEVVIDTTQTTWSNVTISPNGETLVFDMLGDLYSVPVEGGNATSLTSGVAWDFQPGFSPDGQTIAFVSDRAGGDNIWLINADGSNPRAVTDEPEHTIHNPAWSPDGEYLVGRKGFYSTRSIKAGEIWMFHRDGGNGVVLVERPNGAADQKNRSEPVFSRDGSHVYYSADITAGKTWQYNKNAIESVFAIQKLELGSGKTSTVISGAGGAIRPTPSPDGQSIAYLKRRLGLVTQLMVKDLESGIERLVFDGFERDLQESSGTEGNAPSFAWMPDGQSIVFWTAGTFHRVDVASSEVQDIPVRITTTRQVRPALVYPVEMDSENFDVQAIRWASHTPDREKVVFQALGYLWVKDLDSGKQERLTSQTDHFEFYPVISPDGRSVVYTTWDDKELGSVRRVGLNGRGAKTLTREPGHYVEPAFSSDGQQVVFRKITGGYILSPTWSMKPGIYRVDADGKQSPVQVTDKGKGAHFSADGKRIYFATSTGELKTELLLSSINLDGLDPRDHLTSPKATQFRVSPDGRWVAFTEGYITYIAPFFSAAKTVSLGQETADFKVARVAARSGEFLTWSADSSALDWAHGRYLYSRELRDSFAFLNNDLPVEAEPVVDGLDLAFEHRRDQPKSVIALEGGRVVTMRDADQSAEVIEDGVVVIENQRIVAVGKRSEIDIPGAATRIDASGKTIIPGLVDAHAHGSQGTDEITPQQNWMQLSNLAFGVTTIHDPSNDTSEFFAASELQKSGGIVAPRVFGTGTILYGAYRPAYQAVINNLDDARMHLHRLKDVGGISVKSYNQPRRDQRQQVIQAASELGMMVMPEGGMRFQANMSMIVDGHTTIEHSMPIKNVYDDVHQLWSQSATTYTPTFGVSYGGISGENYWYDRTNVWENPRLMRYSPKSVVYPRSVRRTRAPDSEYNHVYVAQAAKDLRELGVRVNIGAHGQREGLAAHWEMWIMEQGGFTPWEALRGATIDGAISLGMGHEIGSIEAGKLADLVIIDGNPLEDLRRSEYVSHTMINGRLYEAATMNQVAPDEVKREPLFFELEGGDSWGDEAMRSQQQKARSLHWTH